MLRVRLIVLSLISLAAVTASAEEGEQPKYEEGEHYAVLANATPSQAPEGKTELIEFFWYGCPHCHEMEPLLKAWLEERTETVHLQLIPAIFSSRWAIGARVYYTLQELDRLDLHPIVFSLVHEQGRPLMAADGIGRMLEPFDIDPAEFSETFRSQAVTDQLETSRELPKQYGINGVPVLVVDGRYRITTRNARDYEMLLDIADYLVREKP